MHALGTVRCFGAHLAFHGHRNASEVDSAHGFRLSVRPSERELRVAREQERFSVADRRNVLRAVASLDGRSGSLRVHQDVLICSSIVDVGRHIVHELPPGRMAWLHIIRGEVQFDGLVLAAGDGVGVSAEPVSFTARTEAEVLLIEVAQPVAKRARRNKGVGGTSP